MVAGRDIARGPLEPGTGGGTVGWAAAALTKAMAVAVTGETWFADARASSTTKELAWGRDDDWLVCLVAEIGVIKGFARE